MTNEIQANPDEQTQAVPTEIYEDIVTLAVVQDQIKRIKDQEAELRAALIDKLSNAGITNGYVDGAKVVTYKNTEQKRFDIDSVKAQSPDVYEILCDPVTGKYRPEYLKTTEVQRLTLGKNILLR